MLAITLYAIALVIVSVWMIITPWHWTKWAVRYCSQPWMHPLEIVICIGFGLPFIVYGDTAILPVLYKSIGYLLVVVGASLMLVPPSLHQRLGARMIERFGRWFRPGGVLTLVLGGLLLYTSISSMMRP